MLFSYARIDVNTLTDEISLFCGAVVAGRYKLVSLDKWDPTIGSKKRLKGVHLETSKRDERKVKVLQDDSTDEIINMDIQHSTLKTSLREIIMEIKT